MSEIRSIVVHIDGTPHAARRLGAARRIAQQLDATLTAVYATVPAYIDLPFDVAGGGAAAAMLRQVDEERRRIAREAFDAEAARPGTPLNWIEAGSGSPAYDMVRHAMVADLLVLGQHDPDLASTGVPADFVESVLLGSGRAAWVCPYIDTGVAIDGATAMVAWKETPESARALTAALPLLRRASRVVVACWEPGPQSDGGQAILGHLRRHGINAEHHEYPAPDGGIGEAVLSMAADMSANWLVMGCYGHTRARELLLGGASRTILKSMTLPVLMSH